MRISNSLRILRAAVLVSVALLGLMLVPPAASQEAGEPPVDSGDDVGFEIVGELEVPEASSEFAPGATGQKEHNSELWMWPEGRRGYLMTGWIYGGLVPLLDQRLDYPHAFQPWAFDLDALEPVAQADREEVWWIEQPESGGGDLRTHGVAVDRQNGLLYVAHNNAVGAPHDDGVSLKTVIEDATGLDAITDGLPPEIRDAVGDDPLDEAPDVDTTIELNKALCHPNPGVAPPCFAGVYVLDGDTLDVVDNIEFAPIGLDGTGIQLDLVDLAFSPPREDGDSPKLHVLLHEAAHSAGSFTREVGVETYHRTNQHYAVQIDVSTGRTDWMSRIGACTGSDSSPTAPGPKGVIFRGPDADRPVVWAGCYTSGQMKAGIARLDLEESDGASTVVGERRFVAPSRAEGFRADPAGERLFVKTAPDSGALWWVFDGEQGGFVARAGIGPMESGDSEDVVDPESGRLYTFARSWDGETSAKRHGGGLGFVDSRRSKVSQYLWDHSLSDLWVDDDGREVRLSVDPATPERSRRVFLRTAGPEEDVRSYVVIEDSTPIAHDVPDRVGTSRTTDVPEQPPATSAQFQGSGRGYGFRAITIEGIDGAVGTYRGDWFGRAIGPERFVGTPCRGTSRTLAFGLAGSPDANQLAVVNHLGTATATAQASYADEPTHEDLDKPYTRCHTETRLVSDEEPLPSTWEDLISTLRVRGSRLSEPSADRLPAADEVECAAPDSTSDSSGDDMFKGFSASVTCREGEVGLSSLARGVGVGPVNVADAGSTVEVVRQDDGGVVAEVESWTRGLSVVGDQGAASIDVISVRATAWANGRSQPEDVAEDPNCDTARTAGSCYRRFFSGVTITDSTGSTVYQCGECADEDNQQQIVDGLRSILGSDWLVNARDPDKDLARGAADGYDVAVVKPSGIQFADATLKSDLLPTLPALEIVRLNDTRNYLGRQVFQFAGVESSISYGIVCQLTVVDGQCQGEPASLTISLTDVDGNPLEGGLFQVQPDADGDGTISVDESLDQPRACTTGPDGTCAFDAIPAGSYVVHQATAPLGYLPAPDKAINLPEGGQGRLDIVNGTPSVTGIAISLYDTSTPPQPLEGAEFEVHAGAAPVDTPLATCTTNANGMCEFEVAAIGGLEPITGLVGQDLTNVLQVPAGPYVIHQSSTPDGYQPAGDITFDLPDGQIARVDLANGVAAAGDGIGAAPSPSPGGGSAFDEPVAFQQPSEVPAPQFTINVNVQQEAPAPAPQVAGDEGNTINVFANPMRSAKLLLRDPKEAAAFAAAWLLFGSAAAAAWRRRMILAQFDV